MNDKWTTSIPQQLRISVLMKIIISILMHKLTNSHLSSTLLQCIPSIFLAKWWWLYEIMHDLTTYVLQWLDLFDMHICICIDLDLPVLALYKVCTQNSVNLFFYQVSLNRVTARQHWTLGVQNQSLRVKSNLVMSHSNWTDLIQ